MSVNPSTHWYWNDWDNDHGLRMCSLAAQGLWMRLLSIAARNGGFVRVGSGQGATTKEIASLVMHPLSEIEPLVEELERWHVFSRTRNGTIYNRRMLKDCKRLAKARSSGKKGGFASYRNKRGIFADTEGRPEAPSSTLNPIPYTLKESPLNPPLGDLPKRRGVRGDRAERQRVNGNGHSPLPVTEPWPQRVSAFAKSGFWIDIWGPKPNEPGCLATSDALKAAGFG